MADISKLPKPVDLAFTKIEPSSGVDNSKNPVVVYHGVFSNKDSWTKLGKEIAEKTKRVVYCFDLRDHNESPYTNEFVYQALISDIVHFLNKHKIEKAVFVGHRLGGLVFTGVATLYPTLVEKLVLVDVHPKKKLFQDGKPNVVKMCAGMLKKTMEKIKSDNMSLDEGKKYLNEILKPHMKHDGSRENYVDKLVVRDGQITWRFNLEVLSEFVDTEKGVEDVVPNFGGHVLEVYGSASVFFTKDDYESTLKMLPNCRFEAVEGGNHILHLTHPNDFVEKVVPFLNE